MQSATDSSWGTGGADESRVPFGACMRPSKATTLVFLLASTAAATEPSSSLGLELAFRTGVMFPAGNLVRDQSLPALVGMQIPLVLDVGLRINEYVSVSITGQYAFGTSDGQCPNMLNCSANDAQVGAELDFHPWGRKGVDAWVGFGFGYEWLVFHEPFPGGTPRSLSGFVALSLDVGIDFGLDKVRLGPFVGLTMGVFSQETGPDDDGNTSTYALEATA